MREIASPHEANPNYFKQANFHPHTELRKLFCSHWPYGIYTNP